MTKKEFINLMYRNAPAMPGMYDVMNEIFYTNNGNGEFTCGPDINI